MPFNALKKHRNSGTVFGCASVRPRAGAFQASPAETPSPAS